MLPLKRNSFTHSPIIASAFEPWEIEIEASEPKTRIKLKQFKEKYQAHFPKTIDAVALRIIEHYLIYFISETCPLITIHDSENNQMMILNDLYKKGISPYLQRETFQAKYETFEIINVKVYLSRRQNRSEIHLCARKNSGRYCHE
jgi:hypothetical protein